MIGRRALRSRRSRLTGGVALLLVGGVLGAAGASGAEPGPGVDAFSLGARAYAIRVTFDTPGSLPIGPLLELTVPESRASLGTGDTGEAFSAVGYPGPVLAGLPQIAATSGVELPPLPEYPLAVKATSSGPTEVHDSTAAPGSSMDAVAVGGRAEAVTRTPALGLPGAIELGSLRATARTLHPDDSSVTSFASTEATGINLLGGLLTVGAVRSTVEATSDGGAPVATASTAVLDASFLGVPVKITADGIELMPGQSVLQGVVASLLEPLGGPNGLLASTGLRIRAGAVRNDVTDDQAVVGAEGLTLEVNGAIELDALESVLDALPPLPPIPGALVQPSDALGLIQSNQIRSLNIGQAVVQLTARPPVTDAAPDLGGDGTVPAPTGDVGLVPDFGGAPLPASAPGTPGAAPGPVGDGASPLPVSPASAALLALGGGLVASVGFRRFADLVLDPVAAPVACALHLDPEASDDR